MFSISGGTSFNFFPCVSLRPSTKYEEMKNNAETTKNIINLNLVIKNGVIILKSIAKNLLKLDEVALIKVG